MNLINKIFGKRKKDEVLEHLENMNNNFMKRIKNYGFETVEEYITAGEDFCFYLYNRSSRYPVTCDC
jgi:hypothetical protein